MKKKLTLLTLCTIFTWVCATAQTQHGIVKTPGRLASNGKVIAGKRIAGATVQVKGRTAVKTAADGTFSFPVPGNSFLIQSVKKQGYILVDPEAITRQYTYSSNPVTFALVIPTEQADDKLAKERQIRNTLEKKLHAREDEIEGLKAQNKISQEEYRKELQRLYAEQESNEKLIKDMAERYTKIDFDELDEFNLRISDCILNGRLTEADSLLRTKGDINARIDRLNKQHEANVEVRDNLEKSEALEQKDRDEIAQDCYHRHELFAMEHQNDSAAHYLELRAALDTTNIEWQNDAGLFIADYSFNFPLALKYLNRGLLQAQAQYGDENEWTAVMYSNVGTIHDNLHDSQTALDYNFKALSIFEKLPDLDQWAIVAMHTRIGLIYNSLYQYQKALDHQFKALHILEQISTNDPKLNYLEFAIYQNIGSTYSAMVDFDNALNYLLKAQDISENVICNEKETAKNYDEIGNVYAGMEEHDKALNYYFKALDIHKKSFGDEHPIVADSYILIGNIYHKKSDYDTALNYYFKALALYERFFGNESLEISSIYGNIGRVFTRKGIYDKALDYHYKELAITEKENDQLLISSSYYDIGMVYLDMGNYNKALECFYNALDITEKLLGKEHAKISDIYNSIGMAYNCNGELEEALEYYFKALEIKKNIEGKEHPSTAVTYNNIGTIYEQMGNHDRALENFFKALDILEKALGKEHPDVAKTYGNIGSVLDNQGEHEEALTYMQKALSINESVLGKEHINTATCYANIAAVFYEQGNYSKTLDYLLSALNTYEKVLGEEDSYTLRLYEVMGLSYYQLEDYDNAILYYGKLVAGLESVYGETQPEMANYYNNLGYIYQNAESFSQAIYYLSKVVALQEKQLGMNHPDIAKTYNDIGINYFNEHNYLKAEEVFKKALDILTNNKTQNFSLINNIETYLSLSQYYNSINSYSLQQFLTNHFFSVSVGDGGPAQQQGMSGEYVLLEFGDWTEDSYVSLFDKSEEMKGKPKDIVVLKDGVISKHHFEDVMGVQLGVKEITKEERERINQLYKTWKRDQALLDIWNSRKKDNSINKQSE